MTKEYRCRWKKCEVCGEDFLGEEDKVCLNCANGLFIKKKLDSNKPKKREGISPSL